MLPSLSPADTEIFTAVRGYLIGIVGDCVEVIQGQVNRVAEPACDDFVMFTPRMITRLSTSSVSWNTLSPNPVTKLSRHSSQVTVQLDIHGPASFNTAQTIAALSRDEYATEALENTVIEPLFVTDPRQAPFMNGENQYENRWTMDLALQICATVSTSQDFMVTVDVDIQPPVDTLPADT